MSTSSPNAFVDLPFTVDRAALADNAIAALQTAWPDWEANDADMEVIVTEALAPMAADCGARASQMPAAALRAYGTKVLGIQYNGGTPALTTVTLTAVDNTGYVVGANSEFEIDGYAFQIIDDATIAPGATDVSGIAVEATDVGSAANGLTGAAVAPISMPAFITTIAVETPTADGTDGEDDPAFTNRISRELQLRGFTLVTATDYVLLALDQPGIDRAVAVGNSARAVTVALADAVGAVVPSPIKTAYLARCNANRLINVTVTIADPTYTPVGVTYHIIMYPGFEATDMVARADAELATILSPANYGRASNLGQAQSAPTDWINDPTIRPNWLVGQLASLPGVRVVDSLSIAGHAGDGTLTLAGTFPLPTPGAFVGSAS